MPGLLFILFTSWLLCNSRGLYKPYVLFSFIFFLVWVWSAIKTKNTLKTSTHLGLFTAAFALLHFFSIKLIYPENLVLLHFHQIGQWLSSLGALMLVGVYSLKKPKLQKEVIPKILFFILCGLLILLQISTVLISPHPSIDVMHSNSIAVRVFLTGHNPYSAVYPDIYQGAYGYSPGFVYFPGILFWLAPFEILFHDIRFGLVAANALTTLALYKIARKRFSISDSRYWVLIFLLFPMQDFVIEQSWIDPILLMAIAWGVHFFDVEKWIFSGIAFGLAASTKQYGLIVPLYLLLAQARTKKTSYSWIAAIALFTLLILAPFAFADWSAFFTQTIQKHTGAAIRFDALSLLAFIKHELGFSPSMCLSLAFTALGFIGSLLWLLMKKPTQLLKTAGLMSCFTYGMSFYFGKFAFCNYYFFLCSLVLITLILSGISPQPNPSPS